MLPTLSPGDRLLAVGVSRVRRGDVCVVRHGHHLLVKRVVGLPGERVLVRDGKALITADDLVTLSGPQPDGSWVLAQDEVLVQGDNREESTDLRAFGPVGLEALVGRVLFRYWPRPSRVR
jgi:signal peptidase I